MLSPLISLPLALGSAFKLGLKISGKDTGRTTFLHQAVNVITFGHPIWRKRAYAQMYGMPSGLSAAVNQFNRAPQLLTAVCRRLLVLVVGHAKRQHMTLFSLIYAMFCQT